MSQKILRLRAVIEMTGLSRSAIYALVAAGEFPQQILLSRRSVGWVDAEVRDWVVQRIQQNRVQRRLGAST